MVVSRSKFRRPGPLDVYFRHLSAQSLASAERSFFAGIQLSNGTFKTTSQQRLDDLNELVTRRLSRHQRLQIMDVGASSGVTTAEWSEHLKANGIDHEITAGDLAVRGMLLTTGRRIGVLWQDDGHPLAVQVGQLTLYLHLSGRVRFVTKCLSVFLRLVYRLALNAEMAPYESAPARWSLRVRPVGLVSRQLTSIAAIRYIQDDITRPGQIPGQYDVCRAANILNRVYFTTDVLEAMASNLLARVRNGGLLVICRTREVAGAEVNDATVFRVRDRSAEVLARLGGGSEVEDLVLAAAATHRRYVA
jgi:hypothetical protein